MVGVAASAYACWRGAYGWLRGAYAYLRGAYACPRGAYGRVHACKISYLLGKCNIFKKDINLNEVYDDKKN
jgi:hypothetical protein